MPRKKKEAAVATPKKNTELIPAFVEEMVVDEVSTKLTELLALVGQYCIFTNDDNDLLCIIESLDPLRVTNYFIRNGVSASDELSIESLDEYDIRLAETDEAFKRLSQA